MHRLETLETFETVPTISHFSVATQAWWLEPQDPRWHETMPVIYTSQIPVERSYVFFKTYFLNLFFTHLMMIDDVNIYCYIYIYV